MTINIIEDFGYCIWLVPQKNHIWNNYSKGFNPHISVYTRLSKDELGNYKDLFNKTYNLDISLKGEVYQTEKNNFFSLQNNVEIKNTLSLPDWWPKNAHISFRYQYNFPFSKKDIDKLNKEIVEPNCIFKKIICMKCIGDYSTWEKVTDLPFNIDMGS